ncbi:hypothetical protein TYRP_013912 [Tyrophagus putrescentiae]|nr:hypothetical protein TYRP_013912 [Tyrophagus putrescentiae]
MAKQPEIFPPNSAAVDLRPLVADRLALALDITGTTLILLAYICITPVKSRLNFLLVERSSKNQTKTGMIIIGGTVLSGRIGRQMLALQSFGSRLFGGYACFYLSVMVGVPPQRLPQWTLLNKEATPFPDHLWVAIFPINILYYCASSSAPSPTPSSPSTTLPSGKGPLWRLFTGGKNYHF